MEDNSMVSAMALSVTNPTGTFEAIWSNPIFNSGSVAVGIASNMLGFQPNHGSASFNDCWGQPLSTIEGGSWDVDPTSYKMEPELFILYKNVLPQAPHPRSNGDGSEPSASVTKKVGCEWAGKYTLIMERP
jgi:hypothetical protein